MNNLDQIKAILKEAVPVKKQEEGVTILVIGNICIKKTKSLI